MIKKLRQNILATITVVMVLVAFAGIVNKGMGYAEAVEANTEYRLYQEYGKFEEWILRIEAECGEDAKECPEWRQKMLRGFKGSLEAVGNKLGIDKEAK